MIVWCAIVDGAADLECLYVGERFVEYEEVVIGEPGQLHRLRTRAGVRDDVPVLFLTAKDAVEEMLVRVRGAQSSNA